MGQTMLSFELSVFDIILSLGVIILIVLFVTTLWKLNPTKENTQSEDETHIDEHEPIPYQANQTKSQLDAQPNRVDTWQGSGRPISQSAPPAPKLVVSATTEGTSQMGVEQAQKSSESIEPPKQTKTVMPPKSTQKTATDKDCFHHFGYLNSLPRNTPIPGECFGCQRIVDCLVTKKK
jgi:hypothetical protein